MKPQIVMIFTVALVSSIARPAVGQYINPGVKQEIERSMRDSVREELAKDRKQREWDESQRQQAEAQRRQDEADREAYRERSTARKGAAANLSPAQQDELRILQQARQREMNQELEGIKSRSNGTIVEVMQATAEIRALRQKNDARAERDLKQVLSGRSGSGVLGGSSSGGSVMTADEVAARAQDREQKEMRRAKAESELNAYKKANAGGCVLRPVMTDADIAKCR